MHIGLENFEESIQIIFEILNSHISEERSIRDILIQLLIRNVSCSDLLFLTLQKLKKINYIESGKGFIKVTKKIENSEIEKIKKEISKGLENKLFITPLEVSKFFQCPRRLWLEKVVLSQQHKESMGKVWDGEAIHFAMRLLIRGFDKENIEEVIERSCKYTMRKYENKITLKSEEIKKFLKNSYNFLKNQNPLAIFSEKKIESLRIGLAGTPDIIILGKETFPIDLKLGKFKKIKEENLLQMIGESLLVESFFRKKVKKCYLINFESNTATEFLITEKMKKDFLNYKRKIIRALKSVQIPGKSKLANYKKTICLTCHVKQACNNIENLKKVIY
jgi:CRISPR/Cas system-associated exonuclease Cas4 (RecB family)